LECSLALFLEDHASKRDRLVGQESLDSELHSLGGGVAEIHFVRPNAGRKLRDALARGVRKHDP
jgi:hypothetical protein